MGILSKSIFERCKVAIGKDIISDETILRNFEKYMTNIMNTEGHTNGLIMHTGSKCFDALLIVYSAITNILFNENNSEDFVRTFRNGDLVLYSYKFKDKIKTDRCEFEKIEERDGIEYAIIKMKDGSSKWIPTKRWYNLTPYYGKSETLGGLGLKSKSTVKDEFIKYVLELDNPDALGLISSSTIIVMNKSKTEELVKNVRILFDDKKMDLLDLVTASYYTESEEHSFGGNAAKVEPVLKFTGKVSTATRLLNEESDNKNVGLIITGDESLERGIYDIPMIMKNRNLEYVFISTTIDSMQVNNLIDDYDDVKVFATNKEMLLSNSSIECINDNKLTIELGKQIDAIIDNTKKVKRIEGIFDWNRYSDFMRKLKSLKYSDYVGEEKDTFIIYAYSLKNLFLTAPFTLRSLDECSNKHLINVMSSKEKMEILEKCIESFPGSAKKIAEDVYNYLKDIYEKIYAYSYKADYIKEFLKVHRNDKVAVVIPKSYYGIVMKESGVNPWTTKLYGKGITVVTANKFDPTIVYDYVLIVGDIHGKRFEAFRCNRSFEVESVLYDVELVTYCNKRQKYREYEKKLNNHSVIEVMEDEDFTNQEIDDAIDKDVEEIQNIYDEMNQITDEINQNREILQLQRLNVGQNLHLKARVSKVLTFETKEKAYLTKQYKAYVFDENENNVIETNISEIYEGDSIIFTGGNDQSRDIVDAVMESMIREHKLDEETTNKYVLSKLWKNELRNYANENKLSVREVAEEMVKNGTNVTEQTIINWLDEGSHTVGPRDISSIIQIGKVTGSKKIIDNEDKIFEACREIRAKRVQVLKDISGVIIKNLSHLPIGNSIVEKYTYERIDELAKILKVEKITNIDFELPMYLTNRPIKN